jgi:hypothetical protein
VTTNQLRKLCRLCQLMAMDKFKHAQDRQFVRKLEYQSDDYRLNSYEAEKLNKVYLDNKKAVEALERAGR